MAISEQKPGTYPRTSGGFARWGGWLITSAAIALVSPGTASAQMASVASAQTVDESDYRVNIGDELEVLVWGEERLQRTVRVQPDGNFAFPLAGSVPAAGMSANAIGREIEARLAPKYRGGPPDVTVTVRDPSGMRFFVIGKVRTPGGFAASGGIDILQALSLAGGLAEFADVKGAVILRRTPQGQTVEQVQLAQVLKGSRRLDPGALPAPLPVLKSGDVLVIP